MNIKNTDKVSIRDRFTKISKKQIPFAASKALNDTAFDIHKAEVEALEKHLDKPTPFTKKAYRVYKASKVKLLAMVKANPIQAGYLKYQIRGGHRLPKKRAIAVPVNQKVNRYGNLPKNKISSLLKQKKVFSGEPGGSPGGVYKVMGGKRSRYLRLLVSWERAADYAKRLPFYRVADDVAVKRFRKNLRKAIDYAMRTAR